MPRARRPLGGPFRDKRETDMRKLLLLLLVGVVAWFGYQWFSGARAIPSLPSLGGLPTRDAQGRELQPCRRCLATGQITCTEPRCKDGQVPCPGRCLKLSDRGWRRMEGQDPNKLFMVYLVNGGAQGVSEAHVGEVFEVRYGKLYALGVCSVCHKQTTIPCKTCGGSGKLVCPSCQGSKVVPKPKSASPNATAPG